MNGGMICADCEDQPAVDGSLCEDCARYHDEMAERENEEQRAEWERQQMDEHFRRNPHG